MATFERGTASSSEESQQYAKFPLRRLEPAIQKFLKVIQIDLSRLHRHRLNVERFNRLQDWAGLHSEQINATRTVQQIKANLQEIERSRLQVLDDDLASFDEKIHAVKQNAVRSVNEFLELGMGRYGGGQSSPESSPENKHDPLNVRGAGNMMGHMTQSVADTQLQLHVLPDNTEVAESWDELQENLQELNQIINQYATLVNVQQEKVDRIEDNIEQASADVNQGVKQLGQASKYKAAMFPVVGAIIGTVVGGPIGLAAGLKIGGLVGAVGGTAGFFSGRFIKKKQEAATDIELSNLSRSNSMPEVRGEDGGDSGSWFSWQRLRNFSESGLPSQAESDLPSQAESGLPSQAESGLPTQAESGLPSQAESGRSETESAENVNTCGH